MTHSGYVFVGWLIAMVFAVAISWMITPFVELNVIMSMAIGFIFGMLGMIVGDIAGERWGR